MTPTNARPSPKPDAHALPDLLGTLDRPHDHMSFTELARSYNYRNTSGWRKLFARLLLDEIRSRPRPVNAIDIGCGDGIGGRPEWTELIRREVDELWGIEPDPEKTDLAPMFTRYQHATMESADVPENHFDVAFSFTVIEHVADPDAFLAAVARCLKPGGVHLFMSVSGKHYFARSAKLLKQLGLEDLVLRVLRGADKVESYHYPVQYRLNTRRLIDRYAARHGFEPPEYVFVENEGPISYMRGPLRPLWALLHLKRRAFRNPDALSELHCRMRKRQR